MKAILCMGLLLCVTLAYASALPAAEDVADSGQPLAAAAGQEDDILEGAEQRWGGGGWGGNGWGGGGWGGGGWGGGRGYGGGRGWGGGGWGGGRGWGGGGYGGRGWGGGWGR